MSNQELLVLELDLQSNYFIDALAKIKHKIDGAVASSDATAERLNLMELKFLI